MPHPQLMVLPQTAPQRPYRPPQDTIPQTRQERAVLHTQARAYIDAVQPVMPLSFDELRVHADAVLATLDMDAKYRDYAAIIINNAAWHDDLAGIPYHRRLLLLPKCLRDEEKCPAPFDEFGLLCKECGLCSLQDLTVEAEKLGYACLVAEGSTLVMKIIETGKIDAIVGVSCLSVLERAFPFMEASAIPGVAIPLLQDDCKDTLVDLDWVWDIIHLSSEDRTYRLNLDELHSEVQDWFTPASLNNLLGEAQSQTETIAREWLGKSGKRWRPFLTACMVKALQEDPLAPLPNDLKRAAIAVECFHKASLAHDDIEDGDAERYGEAALHCEYGMPIALNVGDWLVGEGYRLLASLDIDSAKRARIMRIAADGHRMLCEGQGAELAWSRSPRPLKPLEVLDIFRQKTAPAFAVALLIGANYAGAGDELCETLSDYSEALGIAYQIRDDLDDFRADSDGNDLAAVRPNILLALGLAKAKGDAKTQLASLWQPVATGATPACSAETARELLLALACDERAESLLESYSTKATSVLQQVNNPNVKGLLRRVIGKVFGAVEMEGWCREHAAGDAAGDAPRATGAG